MIRATTPKQMFYFSVDPEENFKEILITYAQNETIVLDKTKADLTFEPEPVIGGSSRSGYIGWFRMSQMETNKFNPKRGQVTVQVRVLTYDNEALASEKKTIALQNVLNDEVLI